MRIQRKTLYERAVDAACRYGFESDDAKRYAKHIFARMVTGGATIGKVNGRLVVEKQRDHPKLP